MRAFSRTFAAALLGFAGIAAISPSSVNAQLIYVQPARPVVPVYVQPAIVPAFHHQPTYIVPQTAPVVVQTYAPPIRYVPQSTAVVSYYNPPTPVYVAPAPGVYSTRTVETRGIFRQRVTVTDNYYYVP